jgi:cadmium resistance protein CadD (predicted permease)
MNVIVSQDKTEYFLNSYFKYLWFKFFIIQEILFILACYFQHYNILSSILSSFILIPVSFGISKLLHKENQKLVTEFYDKNNSKFKSNIRTNDKITVICNLKKFNGPNFGALTLSKNLLMFIPFKENLNNEKFIIDNIKKTNVHISIANTKNSWINKAFFKGNLYCLEVKLNNKLFVLQMPNDDLNKTLFP